MARAEKKDPGTSSWLVVMGLVSLLFIVYWPCLHGEFIWDDNAHLIAPGFLQTWAGLKALWLQPGIVQQYYPLTYTSFWIGSQLWGTDTFGYHLLTLVFHAGNAILFALLLKRWEVPAPWLAAFLFALHPVHVESVAWISELKNTQSTFFFLLAALCYWRFAVPPFEKLGTHVDWKFFAAALLFYLAALFSKTVTGTLPLALFILLAWKRKLRWKDWVWLLPFIVLAVALGAQTSRLENTLIGAGPAWDLTMGQRLAVAAHAFWFYIGKLLIPYPLVFFYPRWIPGNWQIADSLRLGAMIALFAALVVGRKRWGWAPLTMALLYFLFLFPVLGFMNYYPMRFSFVADHFQYVASLPLIAGASASLWTVVDRYRALTRKWRILILGIPCTLFAVVSWNRAPVFASNEALWDDTLAKNPSSASAHNNMAAEWFRQGKIEEAEYEADLALRLEPTSVESLVMRGALRLNVRRNPKEAIINFKAADTTAMDEARRSKTASADPTQTAYLLGLAYEDAADWESAEKAFRDSLDREDKAKASGTLLLMELNKLQTLEPLVRDHLGHVLSLQKSKPNP